MENITQQVRDTVLDLIPHVNHKRLATLIMDGATVEEVKVQGFDDIQFNDYKGLIESVLDGRTPMKAEPTEVTETTQPEETPTQPQVSEESTPKEELPIDNNAGQDTEPAQVSNNAGQTGVVAETEQTQPETTQPVAEEPVATEETADQSMSEPAQLPSEPVADGEMPA